MVKKFQPPPGPQNLRTLKQSPLLTNMGTPEVRLDHAKSRMPMHLCPKMKLERDRTLESSHREVDKRSGWDQANESPTFWLQLAVT